MDEQAEAEKMQSKEDRTGNNQKTEDIYGSTCWSPQQDIETETMSMTMSIPERSIRENIPYMKTFDISQNLSFDLIIEQQGH
jgi:hypothetical protein